LILVVHLLLFINNSNPHYYRDAASLCFVGARAVGEGDKSGKESFTGRISVNKSFTLVGFSLTKGYVDKLLLKKCVVNTKVFIDQEIFNCWEKHR